MKINTTKKFISLILVVCSSQFLIFGFTFTAFAKTNISEKEIMKLVNNERINNGLNPLSINPKLQKAAEEKAEYLLNNNLFSHNIKNQTFSKWIKGADYKYSLVGENLATNFHSDKEILNAWLLSKSHRDNILEKHFTETGISVKEKDNKILVVQIFGRQSIDKLELEETIGNHLSECFNKYLSRPTKKQINLNIV